MGIFLLISVVTSVIACGVLYVLVVNQAPTLRPIPVGPFAPGSLDPSADTLIGQAQVNTILAPQEWNTVTLNKLHEVEDLLDYLEMNQISEREVATLGNAAFCVRWR